MLVLKAVGRQHRDFVLQLQPGAALPPSHPKHLFTTKCGALPMDEAACGHNGKGLTVALDLTPANLVGYPVLMEALRAGHERFRA